MKAEVTGRKANDSYRGGKFTWFFFKCLDADNFGKSYRTCTAPEFRNWNSWSGVKVGMVLDNLQVRSGTLLDADSDFRVVKNDTNISM